MIQTSPFRYGTTVEAQNFTNREAHIDQLFNNLCSGINTIILSPRRWGKTSLVERVLEKINRETDIKTISLDIYAVASEAEFLEVLAREVIKASTNQWEEWAQLGKSLFQRLIPKINIEVTPKIDLSITFDRTELLQHRDEVLQLPQRIAEAKNIRFIIALDEFQNLATFPEYEAFEKVMRAVWQRQNKVSYCIYGSKQHMMTELFNHPSKPFYRFGDLILLPKIQLEKWKSYVLDAFDRTNKTIGDEFATLIPRLMHNHSWYVQQLSHYIWQKTPKNVSSDIFIQALQELVYANSPLYQREVEWMSNTQLNLVKAIISGEKQLTAKNTLATYQLGTSANVVKNKQLMIRSELIYEDKGQVYLLDPVFEIWLRMQFKGLQLEELIELQSTKS